MPSGYRWSTSHSRHVASSGNSRLNSLSEYRDSDEAARIGALRFVLPIALISSTRRYRRQLYNSHTRSVRRLREGRGARALLAPAEPGRYRRPWDPRRWEGVMGSWSVLLWNMAL